MCPNPNNQLLKQNAILAFTEFNIICKSVTNADIVFSYCLYNMWFMSKGVI